MGWPVAWLQEMISMEEFERWCEFHMRYPIDDQSNHHLPIADLHKTLFNINLPATRRPLPMQDFLLFRQKEDPSIEQGLVSDDF